MSGLWWFVCGFALFGFGLLCLARVVCCRLSAVCCLLVLGVSQVADSMSFHPLLRPPDPHHPPGHPDCVVNCIRGFDRIHFDLLKRSIRAHQLYSYSPTLTLRERFFGLALRTTRPTAYPPRQAEPNTGEFKIILQAKKCEFPLPRHTTKTTQEYFTPS